MNNNAYGKTIGILRKRIKTRLVNDVKDYIKHTSKPSFASRKILSKNYFWNQISFNPW